MGGFLKNMANETAKTILSRLWIVILKIGSSIKWFFSMLHPDKSFSSRMCFGMAFICTAIFIFNAMFTTGYSSGMLLSELGSRADKELKMAKIICDREMQKSDTTTTEQLFKMILDSGVDTIYTICLTDKANKVIACNKPNLLDEEIVATDSQWYAGYIYIGESPMQIVNFNHSINICLSDTIQNSTIGIRLIEPMNEAFASVADLVSKLGRTSWWSLVMLVICYLTLLFFLNLSSKRKKQIEGELDIASKIQQQMVPLDFSVFPESHGYDLAGILQPAKEMGGDLLDYVMRDNKLYFCVGDVSGKGMPAALFMSQVHVLFRHVLSFAKDPADICSAMNRSLAEGNDSNMFCTFFLGIVDFKNNILSYCNAGHNKPVLIDNSGKAQFVEAIPNIALGLVDDFPFMTQQMEFLPGLTLVTYTDGVTEAESLDKKVFGDDALLKTLSGKQHMSPSEIVSLLKSRVAEHAMLAEQSDDITMLVLTLKPTT